MGSAPFHPLPTPPDRAETGADAPCGIAAGARIFTLDGALPVEHLAPGDRVVTRAGVAVLRRVTVHPADTAAVVRIAPGALGHDRPGAGLVLGAGQPVAVGDWRAKTLYGQARAMVPVRRLIDGQYIRARAAGGQRLYRLEFDRPQVVYADGVELGCAPVTVTV
ncbi:MAG: Hint domain-containing protein [Gemmobacter sp.]